MTRHAVEPLATLAETGEVTANEAATLKQYSRRRIMVSPQVRPSQATRSVAPSLDRVSAAGRPEYRANLHAQSAPGCPARWRLPRQRDDEIVPSWPVRA